MDIKKIIKKRVGKTLTGKPGNRIETEIDDYKYSRINEAAVKGVVLTVGRMNPPTIGHEKLIQTVKALAKKKGYKVAVALTKKTGDKKNPLTPEEKLSLAKKAFPGVDVFLTDLLISALKHLEHNYTHLTMVVGADRVQQMQTLFDKYNGKDFHFEKMEVVSAGERDPDSDDATVAMSASKLRALALAGMVGDFKKGLPQALRDDAKEIMRMINESAEEQELLDEASLTTQQRMSRRAAFRRIKAKLKMGRHRAMMRRAGKETIERKARVAAKMAMRRKLLGGRRWSEIPLGTRASIDARLAKRAKVIDRVAKRLIPKLRRAEATRKLGSAFVGMAKLAQAQTKRKQAMGLGVSAVSKVVGDKLAPTKTIGETVNTALSMIAEDIQIEIRESSFEKLFDIACEHRVPLETVVECFKRGYVSGQLNESAGFARVHSFLNGGLAANMDNDL